MNSSGHGWNQTIILRNKKVKKENSSKRDNILHRVKACKK